MDVKKITAVTAIIGAIIGICTFLWGSGILKNDVRPTASRSETGQQVVEKESSIDVQNTRLSGDHMLADGQYYGFLKEWSDTTMTVELLSLVGRNEMSYNYEFISMGTTVTLDVSKANVFLEYAWTEGTVIQCKSIDVALNTGVWGGDTKLRDVCPMNIAFEISNSTVKSITFLYEA